MPLNIAKGNMYGFITATWNPIKGICPFSCAYCYMRKWWPKMSAPRLDEKELKTKLGRGNYIFVGSSIDMFAKGIKDEWIIKALNYCIINDNNTYLFQTKNPKNFNAFIYPKNTILCTTIETNRTYLEIVGNAPYPEMRATQILRIDNDFKKMITIEPVIDFDIDILADWMLKIKPMQINIGADSGNNHLPEPTPEKLKTFINLLKDNGLNVYLKPNLNRLLY